MKKALVIPASAVAVALGVYVAGVYYTDYKVNEVLSNLEEYCALQFQGKLPFKVTYEGKDHNLFSQTGTFKIVDKDGFATKYDVDATVKKGFLSADTEFDTSKLTDKLKLQPQFVKDSVQTKALASISALSSALALDFSIEAKYLNQKEFKLTANATFNDKLETSLEIDNLDYQDVYVGNLKVNTHLDDFKDQASFGNGKLMVADLKTPLFDAKTLEYTYKSSKPNDKGEFSLNNTLKGDDLHYIKNYDIDITLSPIKVKEIQEALAHKAEVSYALRSVNTFDIKKLNLSLNKQLGFFIGVPNLDEYPLEAKGKFEVSDPNNAWNSLNGSLEIYTTNNKGVEQIFEKDGKRYKATISATDGRFLLNGKPLR
ncbi:MAG: hypothetical protein SOW38_07280 [Succinivibrio sp.]|nr:hypothetical protein [Succinivibrio sp.]